MAFVSTHLGGRWTRTHATQIESHKSAVNKRVLRGGVTLAVGAAFSSLVLYACPRPIALVAMAMAGAIVPATGCFGCALQHQRQVSRIERLNPPQFFTWFREGDEKGLEEALRNVSDGIEQFATNCQFPPSIATARHLRYKLFNNAAKLVATGEEKYKLKTTRYLALLTLENAAPRRLAHLLAESDLTQPVVELVNDYLPEEVSSDDEIEGF